METIQKHKLVFISAAELMPRYFDYFYLDELCEVFDLEYWDLSNLLVPGFHFVNHVERPWVIKIFSKNEFISNLSRLPPDTLINCNLLFSKNNYEYFKVLSTFFRDLCYINVNTVIHSVERTSISKPCILKSIKKVVYKSDLLWYIVKSLRHPNNKEELLVKYYEKKEKSLFNWHVMSSLPNARYYINNSDLDKYLRVENNLSIEGKYIVYIDQFFPFHPELKVKKPSWDAASVAKKHFKKLNAIFRELERKYGCKIIIAAHPAAEYSDNPYEGRQIMYYMTDKLVKNCLGVLMHCSKALTYAMISNKPVSIIIDDEIRKSAFGEQTIAMAESYNLYLLDIDNISNESDIVLGNISHQIRAKYLEKNIGCADVDVKNYHFNNELLINNYLSIYNTIYR